MHFRKPAVALILVFALLMTSMATAFADTISRPDILLNNQNISSNVNPINDNSTVLVNAKELAEKLGGSFSFDFAKLSGTFRIGENELVFRLDNATAKCNGKYISTPAPMKIISNRIMVPAQFTAGKLGAEVYMSAARNMMIFQPVDGKIIYQVRSGDSLWIVSQLFGTTIASIKTLNGLTGDTIYVGQKLVVKNAAQAPVLAAQTTGGATLRIGPDTSYGVVAYLGTAVSIGVTGKNGSWYKVTTPKGNGYLYSEVVSVQQDIADTAANSTFFNGNIPVDTSKDSVSYIKYTVQKGDTLWTISERNHVPMDELAAANNLSLNASLYIGQALLIPVHIIPVKNTVTPAAGEVLDWFKEAQYAFPIDKVGKFIDLETGKSFMAERTMGASHSDTETLTARDTQTMKEIFGGVWSWKVRPFILEVDGRRFAVSVAGMPHAGIDGVPYLQNVSNRSGNYGYGPNYDRIAGNGMDGHFDVYFLNCLRHVDNQIEPEHQYNVLVSGGLQ